MSGEAITSFNTVWVVMAAAMVLFMEGGFSLLEAGLVRTKNAVNVTMKIFVDLTVGALAFYLIGFGIMFGSDWGGFVSFDLWGAAESLKLSIDLPLPAYVLFQLGFAVAVISIISGAVAERMSFKAYILVALFVAAVLYPISGHWIWNADGWLARLGMKDFAGSAAVHAMGGFSALALAYAVGPRRGRFNSDGSVNVFAPSNIPLASAGAFILWFGWFGFNAGSTLNAFDANLPSIALHTSLAASAGGASSMLYTMFRYGKADPSMTMNGALAGLVAITAGCAFVSSYSAIVIGLLAGLFVIWGTLAVDKMKIDDPVGAVAVHGVNGLFGTVAVGLFDTQAGLLTTGQTRLLLVQLLGVAVVSAWGFAVSFVLAKGLKATVGLRVGAAEEEEGLDMAMHGIPAYNDLERFSDQPEARLLETYGVTVGRERAQFDA
ncbi:ammonium transporter [Paenibacillus flagellatus]|uniref:Ammonium transporter n=1 Tax=Paenibacillus flagellatus TaxID=2211139 RepID=A0A2V5KQ35_9BACL|nr:ammonium transporter [Paenibacillus flagellatus]PYI50706.1 ammonium transporter [Paenibacillus flagellatus]